MAFTLGLVEGMEETMPKEKHISDQGKVVCVVLAPFCLGMATGTYVVGQSQEKKND